MESKNRISVIENLNLPITSGEKVGLVGLLEAGKSTMVNLLMRDNIAYPRPDASDGKVINAASRARAMEFIHELKDNKGRIGLAAHVGDRGIKLSGRQRQLLLQWIGSLF